MSFFQSLIVGLFMNNNCHHRATTKEKIERFLVLAGIIALVIWWEFL
jgi:hypothetical protein